MEADFAMASDIAAATPLVNDSGPLDDFPSGIPDDMPKKRVDENHPIIKALRWIIANRPDKKGRPNMRWMSRKAGLAQSHIEQILNGRQSASIETDTAIKLCRAANVSLRWFTTGDGPREPFTEPADGEAAALSAAPMPPEPVIVYDDRYPNRAVAINLLGSDLHPRARAATLSWQLKSDEDLTLEGWLAIAKRLHKMAKRLPDELDEPEPEQRPRNTGMHSARKNIERKLSLAPPPPKEKPTDDGKSDDAKSDDATDDEKPKKKLRVARLGEEELALTGGRCRVVRLVVNERAALVLHVGDALVLKRVDVVDVGHVVAGAAGSLENGRFAFARWMTAPNERGVCCRRNV